MWLDHLFRVIITRHCGSLIGVIVFTLGWISVLQPHFASTPGKLDIADVGGRPHLGNSTDRLFWFIQLSDIHLSLEVDERSYRFRMFCKDTVPHIDPKFVVVSGDMIHAETRLLHYKQREAEWKMYADALKEYGLWDPTFWIDLRGNHDAYNVPSFDSVLNYYKDYSVVGTNQLKDDPTKRTFTFTYNTTWGSYYFVLFDIVQMPAAGYPLNFFGQFDPPVFNDVKNLISVADYHNHTFLVGHYPMVTFDGGLIMNVMRQLEKPILGFLCGHTHMEDMYARIMYEPTGKPETYYYELELGDFKLKDVFRIVAMDNDLFSFIDVAQSDYPMILVTNPKDSRYLSPTEPVGLIATSEYVRVLVWPTPGSNISSVQLIFNFQVEQNMVLMEDRMWVLKWNPSEFSQGEHNLTIIANDTSGASRIVSIPFTVDGTVSYIGSNIVQIGQQFDMQSFANFAPSILYVFLFLLQVGPQIVVFILKKRGKFEDWRDHVMYLLLVEDGIYPYPGEKGNKTEKFYLLGEENDYFGGEDSEYDNERRIAHKFELDHPTTKSLIKVYLTWYLYTNMWQYYNIRKRFLIPILICVLYIPVGPFIIGTLVEHTYWGVVMGFFSQYYVNGEWVKAMDGVLLMMAFMLWFYLPLLSFITLEKSHAGRTRDHKCSHPHPKSFRGCVLIFSILLMALTMNGLVLNQYGVLTMFLSLGFFWPSMMALVMIIYCLKDNWNKKKSVETAKLLSPVVSRTF